MGMSKRRSNKKESCHVTQGVVTASQFNANFHKSYQILDGDITTIKHQLYSISSDELTQFNCDIRIVVNKFFVKFTTNQFCRKIEVTRFVVKYSLNNKKIFRRKYS